MGGQRSTSGVIRVKGEGVDQRVGRGEVILGRGGRSMEGIRRRGDIYIAGLGGCGVVEGALRGGRDRGSSGGSDEGHIRHITSQGRFGVERRRAGDGWTDRGGSRGFFFRGPNHEVFHCPGHTLL